MWLKKTKSGAKNNPKLYYQIVRSYRDNKGKPRHKVILNLGSEEELISNGLADIVIEKLSELSERFIILNKEEQMVHKTSILGPILALDAVWKKLKMDVKLNKLVAKRSINYDFEKAVKLMILNRLCDPKSKLTISSWKESLYTEEYRDVKLDNLYKSLDVLAENKIAIENDMYNTTIELFKPNIRLVFYDLTTIYFESQKKDDFRRFGYSKDNMTDCTQIVLALSIDENNMPLGYELYKGNMYEGHTVKDMIENLKRKYEIEKVIVVGDKGILSNKILNELDDNGYEYIIVAKIISTPEKYHDEILNKSSYKVINDDLKMKEMEIDNKRLILCHSEKRAHHDISIRTKILEKINNRLKSYPKSLSNRLLYAKYLNIEPHNVNIDADKVEKQSKWDGHFGFYTNNEDISGNKVLEAYRMLWHIEGSFRLMKSTLDLRPIYHWKARRIEGHIVMCFISFYITRYIQNVLLDNGLNISTKKTIEGLMNIHAIEIKGLNKMYHTISDINGDNNAVLCALGCKIPSHILKEEDFVV